MRTLARTHGVQQPLLACLVSGCSNKPRAVLLRLFLLKRDSAARSSDRSVREVKGPAGKTKKQAQNVGVIRAINRALAAFGSNLEISARDAVSHHERLHAMAPDPKKLKAAVKEVSARCRHACTMILLHICHGFLVQYAAAALCVRGTPVSHASAGSDCFARRAGVAAWCHCPRGTVLLRCWQLEQKPVMVAFGVVVCARALCRAVRSTWACLHVRGESPHAAGCARSQQTCDAWHAMGGVHHFMDGD